MQSLYFTSRDGLKLHAMHYHAQSPKTKHFVTRLRPLICLPDLFQNHLAYHRLAIYLSTTSKAPRDVYVIDFRGRGLSERAHDWLEYTPAVEAEDVLDFITLINRHNVSIAGTGRGGIVAMLLAALRPTEFGGFILNDIGPNTLPTGFSRVKEFADRLLPARNWDEAAQIIAKIDEREFRNIRMDEWRDIAHSFYTEKDGILTPHFDPRIKRLFRNKKIPDMWRLFMALRNFPLLALRGENSRHLTEKTMQRMAAIHFWCEAYVVPDQGHSPLLTDDHSITAIDNFLIRTDKTSVPTPFDYTKSLYL